MAIIKEIINGKSKITIHDDYCKNRTPEQIQEIVDNVSRKIAEYYYRQAAG